MPVLLLYYSISYVPIDNSYTQIKGQKLSILLVVVIVKIILVSCVLDQYHPASRNKWIVQPLCILCLILFLFF
jgi:hypothetical protein